MNQKVSKQESIQNIQQALCSFIGTEKYYKYSPLFPNFLLTDGTRYVVKQCEAGWLIDEIAAYQIDPKIKKSYPYKAFSSGN